MTDSQLKRQFQTAVEQFNRQLFFECHDTLEDLWMEIRNAERNFFQGLLHLAVGFYHFENENFRGSFSQLSKADQKLSRFPLRYRGVEIGRILADALQIKKVAQAQIKRGEQKLQNVSFPHIIWDAENF